MKFVLFLYCSFFCLQLLTASSDHESDCEACLATVKAIERSLKKVAEEKRSAVIDHIMKGRVCRTLDSPHQPKDKLISYCRHLFDSHPDHILEALRSNSEKSLTVTLCYEKTQDCIGVKHQSFQAPKDSFADSLDDMLRENKEKLRITNPIHPESPQRTKDEL